jgi:spore coat polysaccharide biosynthesis predicted glycosyltransferase SpsG
MRLLLRADASPSAGLGHLARALAVGEEARARGHDVILSGAVEGPWAAQLLAESEIQHLAPNGDALPDIARSVGAHVVHVDQYGANENGTWHHLREALHQNGVRLSNLEYSELGRRPADLVVDPACGPEAAPRPDDGSLRLALGPSYAPLRRSVLAARERRRDRAGGLGDRPRAMVVMGGGDTSGAILAGVAAAVNADVPSDVLAVSPSPSEGLVAEAMSTRRVRVLATPARLDLPRLLADHDLVICAAGTVAWELCCIGTPMAIVALSDQQKPVYDALVAAGAAVGLGGASDLGGAAGKVRGLMRDGLRRRDLAAAGSALVDGSGAGRVVDLIEVLAAD